MNKEIIGQFMLLVKQVEAEYLNAQVEENSEELTRHKFRLQAIKRATSILKNLDFEITHSDDLKGIPGISKGTLVRVQEIIDTGKLAEIKNKYNKTKQKKIDGIQELESVIGIGPSLSKKLVKKYKIFNVAELKKAIKKGTIEVNSKIKLGLKYYGVVEKNIPRKEIKEICKYLQKEAKKIDPKLEVMICGSYRRGKPTSGDIDTLIYHPDVKTMEEMIRPEKFGLEKYLSLLIDELTETGFLLDHMTDKNYNQKYMGFCQYKKNPVRRIDIRFVPYKSIPTAMLYFTGPMELNTVMRTAAKKRKMVLNEYGLYRVTDEGLNVPLKIESEEDVFEILGMDYLTPEEREYFNAGKAGRDRSTNSDSFVE